MGYRKGTAGRRECGASTTGATGSGPRVEAVQEGSSTTSVGRKGRVVPPTGCSCDKIFFLFHCKIILKGVGTRKHFM